MLSVAQIIASKCKIISKKKWTDRGVKRGCAVRRLGRPSWYWPEGAEDVLTRDLRNMKQYLWIENWRRASPTVGPDITAAQQLLCRTDNRQIAVQLTEHSRYTHTNCRLFPKRPDRLWGSDFSSKLATNFCGPKFRPDLREMCCNVRRGYSQALQ